MTVAEVIQQWPAIVTGLGGLGGGGLIVKLLEHRRAARAQTDQVAMGLVKELRADVVRLELAGAQERTICSAQISWLGEKLRVVETELDGLLLVLKYAPTDKIPAIVVEVQERRLAMMKAAPPSPLESVAA